LVILSTSNPIPWIFLVDQLNTHKSDPLVRLAAEECDINVALGIKDKQAIDGC
jgi:hypothetical protein